MSDLYTCYGCDYRGPDVEHAEDNDDECCPECGTREGEGFGLAENDPADPTNTTSKEPRRVD